MVKNKQCLACRKDFSHCPDCSRVDALKPTWASQFCCESCATLWTTLTKFGMSMITKSEAKEIISSLNLKPIDIYADCVKRDYNKVFEPEKKFKRGKRIEMKPIDEFADIEPVIEIEQPTEASEQVVQEPVFEVVIEKE